MDAYFVLDALARHPGAITGMVCLLFGCYCGGSDGDIGVIDL